MLFPRRHRRAFESLEDRCLLAADLASAEQIGQDLYITGTDAWDNVLITGGESLGEFTVTAAYQWDPDTNSVPSGSAVYHFEGVFGDIVVKLGGGTDVLRIEGPFPTGAHVFGNLTIDLGEGSGGRVELGRSEIGTGIAGWFPVTVDGDLHIRTGGGDDLINLVFGSVHGDARIDTGAGDDRLQDLFHFSSIGGTLSVNLGAGTDTAWLGSAGGNLIVQDPSGDTTLNLHGRVGGNVIVKTGAGNDQIGLGLVQAQKNVIVSTGSGSDIIEQLGTSIVGNEILLTGSGDDEVWISTGDDESGFPSSADRPPDVIEGNLTVDLGTGVDSFWSQALQLHGSLHVRGGGGAKSVLFEGSVDVADIRIALAGNSINGIRLSGVSAHRLTVTTGDALDTLNLHRVVLDRLFAFLGDGADRLFLTQTTATEPSQINGGAGEDTKFAEGNSTNIELLSFEGPVAFQD